MASVSTSPEVIVDNWTASASHIRPLWRQRKFLRESLTPDVLEALESHPLRKQLAKHLHDLFYHPYWSFEPRGDSPGSDEQTSYYESNAMNTVAIGGNACLGGEQEIYDLDRGWRRIDSIQKPFRVLSRKPSGGLVPALASAPFVKGVEELYRWEMSDGSTLVATAGHRALDHLGRWISLDSAFCGNVPLLHLPEEYQSPAHGRIGGRYQDSNRVGERIQRKISLSSLSEHQPREASEISDDPSCLPFPARTNWECDPSIRRVNGRNFWRIAGGYQGDCSFYHRRYGELPHSFSMPCQSSETLLGDVRGHTLNGWRRGGLAFSGEHIRSYQWCDRHSMIRCDSPRLLFSEFQNHSFYRPCSQSFGAGDTLAQGACASSIANLPGIAGQQSPAMSSGQFHTNASLFQSATDTEFALSHPQQFKVGNESSVFIVRKTPLGSREYYDLTVPPFANYQLNGLTHANSGKTYCGAQRVIRFTCEEQPPPKRDTGFWIISDTYEQSCGACWAEKLSTMIPEEWIDWDRITWLSSPRNWPKSVPLKEWPNHPGKNWVLECKSYEQGRAAMQARAIGGAWFSEQFPWNIYTEVFRGLREFGYPGSLWMEFTPIDPAKSVEIQQQYERWLEGEPSTKSWEFYRLNTKAAADAGHVDKGWFESFSAGLTEDMKATRLEGAFASYEGQIYADFNPRVHLISHEEFLAMFNGKMPHRGGIYHKRSLDWGAGEENAFCCLWGMKDTAGTWFIYDEYYTTSQSVTIPEQVAEIRDRHPWPDDPWHRQTYGDPSGRIWMREFASGGMPITPARNEVYIGIETVKKLLKVSQTGEPRLFIVRDKCPNLARQMQTYRWERSSGKGVNPKDSRPVPLKKDDHAVDAARYLLHSDFCDTIGGMSAHDVRKVASKTVPFKRMRA